MFEARLAQGNLLKKILDAIRELITDANFDCNSNGISLQAMDSSHVSLVSFLLRGEGFDPFRCDRNLSLGVNMISLAKILKCAGNDDTITIKAADSGDLVSFIFESPKADRIAEYELKLMDIDSEHVAIPDTEYDATVKMSSAEFQRICRDLATLGDSVSITATKDSVKFSVEGGVGNGSIVLRNGASVDSEGEATTIHINQPVTCTLALRFLNFFTKATPLSTMVHIHMTKDVPVRIEYNIQEFGHVRYYLAPKIEEGA